MAREPATAEMVAKKRHARHLRAYYGMSLDEYDTMLAAQGGVCALCDADTPGGGSRSMVVDHDHETGRIRGLLCHACNRLVGRVEANPDWFVRAQAYLDT